VQPKGMKTVYVYVSGEDIKVGTPVEIPFGKDNTVVKGIVMDVHEHIAEGTPFPVEKTKKILRVITQEEYDFEAFSEDEETDSWDEDLAEADILIRNLDYEGMFIWAYNHHECVESKKVMDKVLRCYELCAEQNNPTAALNLGTMYYNGTAVPQDYKLAAKYYEIAAAAGERRALCNLGYCFYYGRHQETDYDKAYYYFNLCAQLYNDPNCLYKLGDMYKDGKAVEKNELYAFRLYERAYAAINTPEEDQFCRADILFRLGKALVDGTVVERDAETGHTLLMMALAGFYGRRKTDPFVKGLIQKAKEEIKRAEEILDADTVTENW